MKKKIHISVSVTAVVLGLISGCGGGGGGGPPGVPPVLAATAFTTNEDTDLTGQLSATDADGDSLTFAKMSDPSSGTVTSFNGSGAFVYHPNPNFAGTDTFTIRAVDARGAGSSGTVTITVNSVNDAPIAVNDVLRVDGAALASIDVRANDSDPEGDQSTVAIEEPAFVGTASVNSNGTVRLADLPPGFKGVTRFKYRVTDSNGAFNIATTAVFVGADPFRITFAGDENANGSPEVFMTDFVGGTWRVSAASEGNLRLRGFVAAENGSTIAYRREDITAPATTDLSFVRTTAADTQVRVTLPGGARLAQDAAGNDQYAVSPNGQWIAALVTTAAGKIAVYVLDVGSPANLRLVSTAATGYATLPRFSADSSSLYFLASDDTGDSRKALYRAVLSSGTPAIAVSALASAGSDNVAAYSVAPDQSRIALQATRGFPAAEALYFVDPNQPGTEVKISHNLGFGESFLSSTVGLRPGLGGASAAQRVAYTVSVFLSSARTYVAEVSATNSNPRIVASSASAIGFRPDDLTLLFMRPSTSLPPTNQIYETVLDAGTLEEPIGNGSGAIFDSSGDTVILREDAGSSNSVFGASYRGAFGSSQRLGTAGQVARFYDLSGAGRGVVLIGEGGASAANVSLRLINARAPTRLLPLATFQSPVAFTSARSTVVTY